MHLLRMRLSRQGPFDDVELSFGEQGQPRLITVIHGGGGVGKTTLLMAVASTRPGYAVVASAAGRDPEEPATTVCEFELGQDDPERPHPLVVATPNARVFLEDERETLRRREQALFDRMARDMGFVFVGIPATRWFSRQPIAIVGPGRGLARYDVRAPISLDDPTRGDLARETKQILAYAAITRKIGADDAAAGRFEQLAEALEQAVDALVGLVGYRWIGVDSLTLEPIFSGNGQSRMPFDHLPTRARHLVAFGTLSVRALWAAHPARHPLEAEGIVAIDEIDLLQDPSTMAQLVPALRRALPRVQWIVTTSSPVLAANCEVYEAIALRQRSEPSTVEIYTGESARVH